MRTLFYIFILILFYSCQQEESINITVNGQVTNRITGLPLSNARVKLYSCESSNFFIGTCTVKEEKYTDANGNFTFNYTKSPSRYYKCELNEPNYFPSDPDYNINNYVELNSNSNQNINLSVVPETKIWLKINNIGCFDNNDLFVLSRNNQISNFNFGGDFQMFGCDSYDDLGYADYPMGFYYFHWQVTKNSITNDFYDTLYLNAFQDTIYTINY